MSASIYWSPVGEGVSLDVGGAPSSFVDRMIQVFGKFPLTLGRADVEKLSVLSALFDTVEHRPFEELISIIDNSGTIKLWATY